MVANTLSEAASSRQRTKTKARAAVPIRAWRMVIRADGLTSADGTG
jgi:hypothetical protein